MDQYLITDRGYRKILYLISKNISNRKKTVHQTYHIRIVRQSDARWCERSKFPHRRKFLLLDYHGGKKVDFYRVDEEYNKFLKDTKKKLEAHCDSII